MSNPTDYSIHRTTGTGEIPTLRTVTGQKEERRKRLPGGKRKRRPGEQADEDDVQVELTEEEDAEAPPDAPPDAQSEEAVSEDEDHPEPPALDYLV